MNAYLIPGLKNYNYPDSAHIRIISTTCNYYGISFHSVLKRTRKREIVRCRQVLSYLLYYFSDLTQVEIANALGYNDHSDVSYAKDKIIDYLSYDKELITSIGEIKELAQIGEMVKKMYCGKTHSFVKRLTF